jgi:hypothetical protein
MGASTCDQCGAAVEFGQPSDATYRGFYHLPTGRAACGGARDPDTQLSTHVVTISVTVTTTADEADVQYVLLEWADATRTLHDVITDNLTDVGHDVELVTLTDDREYHEAEYGTGRVA